MTLKTRNRITRGFFIFSLICVTVVLVTIIAGIITDSIHPETTPNPPRSPEFLNSISFMPVSVIATFISAAILFLAVPVILFLIEFYFQNTQTSEIVFFYGFIFACLTEGIRILNPLFDLSNSFSDLFIFLSRILFMGKLLAPLSFTFSSFLSDVNQRHDIERNFFLMIAISCIFAVIIPVNTAQISTTFEPTYGFATTFNIGRIVLILVTFISFILSGRNHDSPEIIKLASDFTLLIMGYLILTVSDNYVLLITGSGLFLWGTTRYLINLHKIYMWK